MKKSTAIQTLKDQREALKTATNIKDWRDITNAFLEEAMNTEKQAFKDFKYYQENDIAGLTSRLDLCISIVEKTGVHGASKVNWFARQPTWQVIGAAIVIAGGLSTAAYTLGRDSSSNRIDGLVRDLSIARDSLLSLSEAVVISEGETNIEQSEGQPPNEHSDSVKVQH